MKVSTTVVNTVSSIGYYSHNDIYSIYKDKHFCNIQFHFSAEISLFIERL